MFLFIVFVLFVSLVKMAAPGGEEFCLFCSWLYAHSLAHSSYSTNIVWLNGFTDGQTDRRTDGWMERWTDG